MQYRPQIKAQKVYFSQSHFVSLERVAEMMSDLYGQPVSEGKIVDSWLDTVTEVAPVNAQVKQQLTTHETVTHHDETGARVNEKLAWLHSTNTANLTDSVIRPVCWRLCTSLIYHSTRIRPNAIFA